MVCRATLCAAYGDSIMWTGVVWIPVGSLGHPDHVGDKRVVEKVDECMGVFTLAISFRNVVDRFD
jgi:hypothetical protein